MKKFSFFWMAALALVVGCALVACSQDESLGTDPEPDFYTVQLSWDGEILDVVGYEPLTRASSADDLYGIQVYSRPDDDATTPTWTPYAYGLFDGATDITINLLKGYKYKFVATMVRDGKNKIAKSSPSLEQYFAPFSRITASGTTGTTTLDNAFDYQQSTHMNGLENGKAQLKNYGVHKLPNTDRFYGELVDYVPGDKNATAKINMKRTAFGAKFIAKGKKAKEGTLHVQMTSAPAMELALTTNENKISDIFTFSNVAAAWADNKYTETIDVSINWERADGTTLPLGTHAITYKRNATTVVQVKIENDGADGGLGFEIDESETGEPIEDGENDVTIEDGEVVDTDVDTNGGSASELVVKSPVPSDEIWYSIQSTAAQPELVYTDSGHWGANIISHNYNEGEGIIKFDGNVTKLCPLFNSYIDYLHVSLPEGVTGVESGTFCMESIVSIDLPTTISYIGHEAFFGANNIFINCRSLIPPTLQGRLSPHEDSGSINISIKVPSAALDVYKAEWPQYAEFIS